MDIAKKYIYGCTECISSEYCWGTNRGETLTEQLLNISLLNDLAATWLHHLSCYFISLVTFRHISPKCDMSATVPPLQCQCVCAGCYVAPDGGVTLKTIDNGQHSVQDTGTGHQASWPLRSAPLVPVSCVHAMLLLVACIYCFPSVLLSAAPGSEWSCTLGEISSWIVFETSAVTTTVQWLFRHSRYYLHCCWR